jgi:hypothetical protein
MHGPPARRTSRRLQCIGEPRVSSAFG